MICAMRVIIITEIKISKVIQESFVKRVKITSMKKVIMFLLLSVMMIGVVSSCKSENKAEPKKELSAKDELLIEAKNGLKNYINDRARNPETFKTSDMRVEYLSDSACVIKFRFVAENQFGGHVNEKAQWIWLKYNGDTYQSWQDTSDDDICEFGKRYLQDDDELDPSLTIVCLDVVETDQYARSLLVKNNVLSFDNSYGVLYCIIKKIGEKVKENKNTDISSLKTW